ncbi:MAG: xylulokinase [Armatimonadota bacterium]
MSAILVIDAGTTAFKAVVFDNHLRILGISTQEFEVLHPAAGQSELNADTYWQSCVTAVQHAFKQAAIDPASLAAISVTSHTDTLFALDASGRTVANAILWTDPRAQENADAIQHKIGPEKIFRATGQTGASSVHFASRLAWFIQSRPELDHNVRHYLQTQDFLIYRLCGQAVVDQSISCCSLLGYLDRNEYWPEALDVVGVDAGKLSRIVAAGESAGKLTAEAARTLSLPEGIPVIAGAMDAAAAQIALGNVRPGIVTEITGAALVIGATCDVPIFDDRMSVPCFAHAAPGKYLFLPWCETAGAALKWYRDQFFVPWAREESSLYNVIDAEAAEAPPGSDGVLLLPHFAGSGSPDFNSDAKAAIWGLTMAHERKHISRALLESVAFILKRNLDLLAGMGVPMERIISSGGGSKSALWCQIKADVTGLPVAATDLEEATATGAAILAGQALGWWDYDTAPLPHGTAGPVYEPSPVAVRHYEDAYRRFVELDRVLQAFSESPRNYQ